MLRDRVFILADGDRVRTRVESYLLRGELDQLSEFSKSLAGAVAAVASNAEAQLAAKVVVAAGDDIHLPLPLCRYNRDYLEQALLDFKNLCGTSLSVGVGTTVESAYVALRLAKAQGGDQIVEREIEL
jgi:hypothetical protein